jgi:hypothetical protein
MIESGFVPAWRSHKTVHADKIISAVSTMTSLDGEGRTHHWELEGGAVIKVLGSLRNRVPDGVNPVGGYYVQYDDGFESWSPAAPFEEGYIRIGYTRIE